MKLLDKYNRINIVSSLVVLLITGFVYFLVISYILNRQINKDLKIEEKEISNFISLNNKMPPVGRFKDLHISFDEVSNTLARHFVDTVLLDSREGDYDAARALISSVSLAGKTYKVTIIESKVETEDLIGIISKVTILVLLFLLTALFVTNRFILSRTWQPFYHILKQLNAFKLTDNNDVLVAQSAIDEFNELGTAVAAMAATARSDYRDLKAFTENASHELLTPIAVINSKLDSLIQAGDYNEAQSKLLADVYGAVSRLTRINQSFLLMVKIENHLLADEQLIDLDIAIADKTEQFKELFLARGLQVAQQLSSKQLYISRYLLDVLLNNLLSNALRHNVKGGAINITLTGLCLMIQNTGTNQALVASDIFQRFKKSASSEGSGLGLTITRQICDSNGLALQYSFEAPFHTFIINF